MNIDAQRTYEQIVEQGGRVADVLRAFKTLLFSSDMMNYLAMKAPRSRPEPAANLTLPLLPPD